MAIGIHENTFTVDEMKKEGYNTAEIAGIFNLKEGTVRIQLRCAREMLKTKIQGEWDDAGDG